MEMNVMTERHAPFCECQTCIDAAIDRAMDFISDERYSDGDIEDVLEYQADHECSLSEAKRAVLGAL